MKIAITATDVTLDATIDLRFGRAKHFLVYDTESASVTAADNAINLHAEQGAGIQAAKSVADLGVSALITGHVGPKAFAALQAAGITVYTMDGGTAAEAISQFRSNSLQALSAADVESHW